MGGHDLTSTVASLDVDDRGWPVVVVHPAPAREGTEPWRLRHGLDGVLGRAEPFGLVFDLRTAGRGAGMLVETALAERASTMAARCVGAATVVGADGGGRHPLAAHPVLFPFPSVSARSVDDAVTWLTTRLTRTRTPKN